jgi:predicted transposase YbfD/YdcC
LLKTLPLKGVTITGDAIFTQRAICQTIIGGGGDYFFTVKGNQAALKADIEQTFRPFPPRRYGRRRLTSDMPRPSRRSRRDRNPTNRNHSLDQQMPGIGLGRGRAGLPHHTRTDRAW